jgi:hypothetical protein
MVAVTGGSRQAGAPAVCPLKDRSFTCARGEQAKWLRGEQEKRRSSVRRDDKLPPAVFEKGLREQHPNLYIEPKWLRCPEGQGKDVHVLFDTG